MSRILSLMLILPSLALADGPGARVVFNVKVVAEEKNGMWRPGDTRVGDQFALLELPDGKIVSHKVEANHSRDPKAEGVDWTAQVNVEQTRRLFHVAGLAGFDFETQLAAAKKTEYELTGFHSSLSVLGGTTVEVFSNFEGTNFQFVCKDLDEVLPHYARYNSELARLLALLEDLGVFRLRRYSFTE
jgi:hypothetical protein